MVRHLTRNPASAIEWLWSPPSAPIGRVRYHFLANRATIHAVFPSGVVLKMLIPLGTDAPLYHYPIATVGMIVVNTICFMVFGPADPFTPWLLHYGSFNPIEWVLSVFMHVGWMHLISNMFFLWAFGLIVEGKLGWKQFIAVYMLIGVSQSAIEQTIMLTRTEASVLQHLDVESREQFVGELMAEDQIDEAEAEQLVDMYLKLARGASCGASSVIFGLLAICLVWAPKNEFNILLIIFIRPIFFELTILWYSIFYIGTEVLWFTITGFNMGTSALHLMGAVIGFGVGVLYLKKDWVDCENWDLFKVLNGKYGRFADASTTVGSHADPSLVFNGDVAVSDKAPASIEREITPVNSSSLKKINSLIDSNSIMEAAEEMYSLQLKDSHAKLDQKRLKRFSQGLIKVSMLDDAELYLEEYIERFPLDAAWARVRSAEVLLHNRRPSAALMTLKQVRLSQISDDYQTLAKKIVRQAKKLVNDGVQDETPEW